MTSISQSLVFTSAMIVSSTVLYLAFSWNKITPPVQNHCNPESQDSNTKILRSCLYSEEKKRERKMTMKKKKVQFAENVIVKEERETSEEVTREKKQRKQNRVSSNCRHETPEIRRMPANRIALYNGILRDRVHRMECSY